MRRLKNSLLYLALAATCLAQGTTPLTNPKVRRIGEGLRCMCGGCNYTLTDCNMLSCSGAEYGRAKLGALVAKGMSEAAIKAEFVKEFGPVVLTKPPTQGFFLLGWIMPFVAILIGLLAIWWFVKRFLAKPVTAPAVDPEILSRYRERIEKDLAKLD
jgi:cytochrome c-type biogenesis protein CcmH/NrfF